MIMNNMRILVFAMLTFLLMPGCSGFGGFGGDIEGAYGPEFTEEGVRFSLYSTEAGKVAIAGSFNNWSKNSDQLSYNEQKGLWEITIPLSPGRYEYRFVIDGEDFIPDPGNPDTVDDGFGGLNSVATVE